MLKAIGPCLVSLLLVSFQTNAGTQPDYDALYSKCVDDSGLINNAVVAMCSESVSEQANAEMTQLYSSIYEHLRSESQEDADKFKASQEAWVEYRDGQCALAGSYIGSPMYYFCPMTMNAERIVELRELKSSL